MISDFVDAHISQGTVRKVLLRTDWYLFESNVDAIRNNVKRTKKLGRRLAEHALITGVNRLIHLVNRPLTKMNQKLHGACAAIKKIDGAQAAKKDLDLEIERMEGEGPAPILSPGK